MYVKIVIPLTHERVLFYGNDLVKRQIQLVQILEREQSLTGDVTEAIASNVETKKVSGMFSINFIKWRMAVVSTRQLRMQVQINLIARRTNDKQKEVSTKIQSPQIVSFYVINLVHRESHE